jgi:hypothetical protein
MTGQREAHQTSGPSAVRALTPDIHRIPIAYRLGRVIGHTVSCVAGAASDCSRWEARNTIN